MLLDGCSQVGTVHAMTEKLITEREVAELLGQPLGTTRGWRARGDYPIYLKLPNGKVMVSEMALQAWLDSCAVTP
ncbi:unannotated protein [freshwater metagenome]|jgi:hypothetical protein|uniref:Unannotated protein n=1 Tax=freshwater metagenome TaxID=449393 RepID=A0A6J6ZUV8_9ZZZZ